MNSQPVLCFARGERVPACCGLIGVLLLLLTIRASASNSTGAILVPAGSTWKYLDTGANLPSFWSSRLYSDATWREGAAQLGYGDGDEVTTVSFGPDPDNKYVTTYFRQTFVITNAASFNQLTLSLLRDDGAVIYLNGAEVWRNNMPAGIINYRTLASTNVYGGGETNFYSTNIGTAFLLTGTNILAAEVHQAGGDSLDLSFDLQLTASNVLVLTRGPYLQQLTTTSIVVRWRTSLPSDSRVQFSDDAVLLDQTADNPALLIDHEVKLTGLTPDWLYYYSVGSTACVLAEDPQSLYFLTAPEGARPTRIWAIGDAGTAGVAQRAVRDAYYAYAEGRLTDVWLMLGDNAYNSGADAEYQKAVFNIYPDLLRQTAVWTTIGNHDTYSTTDSNDYPYLKIFSPPVNGEAGGIASGTKKYYSFNHANIHFVCLDSMTSDRSTNGVMLTWLQQDLAANTNDWLIAFWHHPPYSKGSHDSDDAIFNDELVQMRENVVPLLESYGVDLVLCGHSHSYERSYLINGHYGYSQTLSLDMIKDHGDGRIDGFGPYTKAGVGPWPNQGTVYTVAGSSGQVTYGTLDHPAMCVSLDELGSVVLDIDGNRLDAQFLRETGEIRDHYTLLKGVPDTRLRLVSIHVEGDFAMVTWKSQPGKYYNVERATSLLTPDWVLISPDLLASGEYTSWSDLIGLGSGAGYYRVLRLNR